MPAKYIQAHWNKHHATGWNTLVVCGGKYSIGQIIVSAFEWDQHNHACWSKLHACMNIKYSSYTCTPSTILIHSHIYIWFNKA